MDSIFAKYSTKMKLAKVLLTFLDWGCTTKWSDKSELEIQKRLKVQHTFDPFRIRSCIDLIEDTEDAILSFSKYGLQKYNENNNCDHSEMYLRLYGILSAIQQQKLAIIELYDVLKLKNKKKIIKRLNKLQVIEIRNVIGAHTVNLKDSGDYL